MVLVFALLVGSFWFGLLLGVAFGWLLPSVWLSSRSHRRQRAFAEELPDFLMLMASSLRAGLSFNLAMETSSAEGRGEVGRQMRRVLREVQVGASLDDALIECAERMDSEDMRWVVTALGIQREVGGNLSTILDSVAATIKGRFDLQREVRTLSAEGRLSAIVIALLPFGFFGFMFLFRRQYIEGMWQTPLGLALLAAAASLLVIGIVWIRSVVRIKV